MFLDKIHTLCTSLEISVPNSSPLGEYFIPFDDSIFIILQEKNKSYVFWSLVALLPTSDMEYSSFLRTIGTISMKLLTGLTSEFFPTPFIVNHELRLGIQLPSSTTKAFLDPIKILVEDVHFWRENLGIGITKPIINHTSRILKF